MAEVEAVPASAALVERKERIKLLPKPDDAEMQAQTSKLNDGIQAQKNRIAEVSDIISARHAGRSARSGPQGQLRTQLVELGAAFKAELATKQRARADLERATKACDALRNQTREMRGKIKYMTPEAIDEQISRLEERMNHSSMSLNEERKTLDDIKRLKASRSTVQQYNERIERLQSDDGLRQTIVKQLETSDKRLNEIQAQQDQLRTQLDDLRSAEQSEGADIPTLIAERDECREVINQLYAKIKEIRAEFKVKNDEYYERQRAFRAQQAEERAERRAKQQAEWEERQKVRAATQKEMAGEPFDAEVTKCEQLAAYLAKFTAQAEAHNAAAADGGAAAAPPKGYSMPKKKDEDEDFGYSLGGGGKKGKGGKKAKGAAKAAEAEGTQDRKITHSLDMLGAFQTLKVEVPNSTSKVQGTLEAIEARKVYYLKKRAAVKDGTYDAAADPEAPKQNGAGKQANGAAPGGDDDDFEHVDRSEAEGPDAQAQIARLVTQQGPQAEPTASALAEHDAAFPAIGQGLKADGIPKTVPRDSASVAATTGGESVSGAPEVSSCVSVVLTLQDDDSVTLSLSTDEDGRCWPLQQRSPVVGPTRLNPDDILKRDASPGDAPEGGEGRSSRR